MAEDPQVEKLYDDIAKDYDKHDNTNQLLATDKFVYGFIKKHADLSDVVDLGCGTGRAIEWLDIPPESYCGVDLSAGMLAEAKKKHPEHYFSKGDIYKLDHYWGTSVLSLYGSPCYATKENLVRLMMKLYNTNFYFVLYGEGRNKETFEASQEAGKLHPLTATKEVVGYIKRHVPTAKFIGVDAFKKWKTKLSVNQYYMSIYLERYIYDIEKFAWVLVYNE